MAVGTSIVLLISVAVAVPCATTFSPPPPTAPEFSIMTGTPIVQSAEQES